MINFFNTPSPMALNYANFNKMPTNTLYQTMYQPHITAQTRGLIVAILLKRVPKIYGIKNGRQIKIPNTDTSQYCLLYRTICELEQADLEIPNVNGI